MRLCRTGTEAARWGLGIPKTVAVAGGECRRGGCFPSPATNCSAMQRQARLAGLSQRRVLVLSRHILVPNPSQAERCKCLHCFLLSLLCEAVCSTLGRRHKLLVGSECFMGFCVKEYLSQSSSRKPLGCYPALAEMLQLPKQGAWEVSLRLSGGSSCLR